MTIYIAKDGTLVPTKMYIKDTKNLLDLDQMTGSAFLKNEDGSYSMINDGYNRFSRKLYITLPPGKYRMSAVFIDKTYSAYLRCQYIDGTYSNQYLISDNIVTFDKETAWVEFFLSYLSEKDDYYTFKEFSFTKNLIEVEPYILSK